MKLKVRCALLASVFGLCATGASQVRPHFSGAASTAIDAADLIDETASEVTFKREYDEAEKLFFQLRREARTQREKDAAGKIGAYIEQRNLCRLIKQAGDVAPSSETDAFGKCIDKATGIRKDALTMIGQNATNSASQ